MGFGEAVKSFYKRYFDFEGRSSRSEYWWVALFQLIVYIVLGGIMIAGAAAGGGEEPGPLMFVGFIPFILFALANIIPSIALTVRRFHDQDKSGWMYLLAFVPYAGGIIILIFMAMKGTEGENRFGLDPLGQSLAETFD